MDSKYSPLVLQSLMNISLIYAIIAIKHDFSIHKYLPDPSERLKPLASVL